MSGLAAFKMEKSQTSRWNEQQNVWPGCSKMEDA